MEDLYKHIESLGKEHGYKNMTVLCKAAGVPRSTMSELNNGRSKDLSKPNAQKFADILGVTLDEVYGEETKKAPDLTEKDERDIGRRLMAMIEDLNGPIGGLSFDGEPIDDETRQLLEVSLRNQLEISKRIAKQKFTPKKYRKEGE